jgi:hypothetical protein
VKVSKARRQGGERGSSSRSKAVSSSGSAVASTTSFSNTSVLASSNTTGCSSSSSASVVTATEIAATTSSTTTTDSVFTSRFAEKALQPLPVLSPGQAWEVVLLIDSRERSNAFIQSNMAARSIPCEMATLAVGDFLWIVRPRGTHHGAAAAASGGGGGGAAVGGGGCGDGASVYQMLDDDDEGTQDPYRATAGAGTDTGVGAAAGAGVGTGATVKVSAASKARAAAAAGAALDRASFVLDCIAERKSVPDLVSSISDGRYMEQKARLKVCGLRSTVYIVEGEALVSSMHQRAISANHLKAALISIHVSKLTTSVQLETNIL